VTRDSPQVSETVAAFLLGSGDSCVERSGESSIGSAEIPVARIAPQMREDTDTRIADGKLESLAAACAAGVGLSRGKSPEGAGPVTDRVVDQLADGLEDERLQSGIVVVLDHLPDPHGNVVSGVLPSEGDYLQEPIGQVLPPSDRQAALDPDPLREMAEHVHPFKIGSDVLVTGSNQKYVLMRSGMSKGDDSRELQGAGEGQLACVEHQSVPLDGPNWQLTAL
jgi:hypothetical protein